MKHFYKSKMNSLVLLFFMWALTLPLFSGANGVAENIPGLKISAGTPKTVASLITKNDILVAKNDLRTVTEDDCDITVFPYVEDFSSYEAKSYPNCWRRFTTNTATTYPCIGNQNLDLTASAGRYCIAITPLLDYDINLLQLSYTYSYMGYASTQLEIGVISDVTKAETFEMVAVAPLTGTNNLVSFADYKGTGKYIAFKWINSATSADRTITIDNIVIKPIPSCAEPTDIAVSNVGARSALLKWTESLTEASNYEIEVEDNNSLLAIYEIATGTSFVMKNLEPNTDYTAKIRANCDAKGYSDWATKTFKTINNTQDCVKPNVFTVKDSDFTSVLLTWAEEGLSTQYELQYKRADVVVWEPIIVVSNVTEYELYGLNSGTRYNARIRPICVDDAVIAWTEIPFTTACEAITTMPFIEKFNTTPGGNGNNGLLPTCWSLYATSTSNLPHVNTNTSPTATSYHSAFGSLSIPQSNNMAILPAIDLSMSGSSLAELQVELWAKPNGTIGGLVLGIMSDPQDRSTFVRVDSLTFESNSVWKEFKVKLDTYPGDGKYIALLWQNGNAVFIDDIYIDFIPSCTKLDTVFVNTTNTSVRLDWNNQGIDETQILCVPHNTQPNWNDALSVPNSNTRTITDLYPNTKYDLYVRKVCFSGGYSMPFSISFTTDCGIITTDMLPYAEPFDTYGIGAASAGIFPSCWTKSATFAPYINSSNLFSLGALLFPASSDYSMAVMPKIDASIESLKVDFKLSSSNINNVFEVGIWNNNTFTLVSSVRVKATNTAEDHTVYFNTTSETNGNIAFRTNNSFNMDNVVVDFIPSCPPPNNLHVVNVLADEVTLGWTENGNAQSWTISYGPSGYDPDDARMQTLNTNDNPVNFYPLTPKTSYDVYVKANCGEATWSDKLTFRTITTIATIPYITNFEDETENDNWLLLNEGQTNKWYIHNRLNYTPDGSSALYISNDNGATNAYSQTISHVYAMRTLNFTETGEYDFSLFWRGKGDYQYDLLRIFLVPSSISIEAGNAYGMSTSNNPTPEGWLDIGEGKLYGKNQWEFLSKEFVVDVAGTYNLVLYWKNYLTYTPQQPPAAIDDIVIRKKTCPTPKNLNATAATESGATLGWTETGVAEDWEIQSVVQTLKLGTGTSLFANGSPTIAINDLSPKTFYDVYVRAICGVGDTSRWIKSYFATQCEPIIDLPFIENFENAPLAGEGKLPLCWDRYSTNGHNYPFIGDNPVNLSTSYLEFNVADLGYNMVMLPPMEDSIKKLQISFSAFSNQAPSAGTLTLGVLDNPADPSTYVAMTTIAISTQRSWEYNIFHFYQYTGSGQYIAFKWEGANGHTCMIDNVNVDISTFDPSDTCARPLSATITNITESTARVSWNVSASESQWSLECKLVSDNNYGTPAICNAPNYTLNGLTPSTTYDVRIRSICETDKVSEYVTLRFTTTAVMPTYTITPTCGPNGTISPANEITVNEGNSATFTFTPAENYRVQRVLVDNNPVGNATTYTFTNVTENHTIHVDFEEIDTTAISQYLLDKAVVIYPNPTQENLFVKMDVSFEQVEITNLLGQTIYAAKIDSHELMIDVTNYRSGIYFIRMEGKQGVVTKKFVKE